MPRYQITDSKSGTTLVVEGDSPPSEAEAEELFLQAVEQKESSRAASRVAPSPYGIGTMPVDNEQVAEMTKGAARFAPAVVAGMATGGAGLIPTLAATSLAGAGGEVAAEGMEVAEGSRQGMSGRDIAAAGITSTMGTPLRVGSGLGRAGVNALANLAVGEAGQAVQEGGWQAPEGLVEYATRFGLPPALGAAGSVASKAAETATAARRVVSDLSGERMVPVGKGVLLSHVLGDKYSPLEQRLWRDNVAMVHREADNMTVGLSDYIQRTFASTGLVDEELAQELVPYLGKLKEAETNHAAAIQARDAAEARLKDLRSKGLAPEVLADVEKEATMWGAKAVETESLRQSALKTILGDSPPTLASANAATRLEAVSGQVKVLDEAYASARNKLYGEKVGIGLNEPMVSKTDFDSALNSARGSGTKLAGNSAFTRVKTQAEKVFAGREELSREDFLNFRDRLAKDLADESEFADSANKIAAEAYAALTNASDAFIRRSNPAKADALKRANKVMSEVYGSRASDALEKLRAGDIDGFTDTVIKQGNSKTEASGTARSIWTELTSYAKAGTRLAAASGDSQANEAVMAFYNNLGKAMKDSIAMRALDGASSASQPVMNMDKFTADLMKLANTGFDLKYLGIRDINHVKAARSIAETLQDKVMTPAQLDQFLEDAATLGASKAGVKLRVEAKAQEYYLNKLRNPLYNQKKLVDEITELTGSLKATEAALEAAKADPIAQLLDGTGLGLSKDPINNGQWISRMIVAGPQVAGAAVDALEKTGKHELLKNIRLAAIAHVFQGFMEADKTGKTQLGFRVKLGDVKDYFGSASNFRRNETLKALLGTGDDGQWKRIEMLKGPLERAESALTKLKARPYQTDIPDAAILAAGGARLGGGVKNIPFIGWIRPMVNAAMNLARQGRYKTLHLLYIDPYWSKRYEMAGRSMEKFLQNPSAAVAYRLANQEDDEAQAERESMR